MSYISERKYLILLAGVRRQSTKALSLVRKISVSVHIQYLINSMRKQAAIGKSKQQLLLNQSIILIVR